MPTSKQSHTSIHGPGRPGPKRYCRLYLLKVGNMAFCLFMLTERLYISKPILLQEMLFNSQLQLLKYFILHYSNIILNTTAILSEPILHITFSFVVFHIKRASRIYN